LNSISPGTSRTNRQISQARLWFIAIDTKAFEGPAHARLAAPRAGMDFMVETADRAARACTGISGQDGSGERSKKLLQTGRKLAQARNPLRMQRGHEMFPQHSLATVLRPRRQQHLSFCRCFREAL
jgi:hypothetical protein